MFQRIKRVIKSWLGYIISFTEDPEVMLREAEEELRNSLPRLNQVLISTRATVIKLADDEKRLTAHEQQLVNSIHAALKEGTPEARSIAEDDAGALQQVREDLAMTSEQLDTAQKAHENALIMVDEMRRRLREQILRAQRAVEEHRRAKIMGEAAAALSQLDAYDTGATMEKYVEEVRQKSAESKAALEISMGGDLSRIKKERDVRKARARGLLAEFEEQMKVEQKEPAKIEGETE